LNFISLLFKKEFHLFFGEHGGKFIGNNKYFFLRMHKKLDKKAYWVVDNDLLYQLLIKEGMPVLHFSKLSTRLLLLRAGFFYFDNMTWQRKYSWLRFFNNKIIHMSHGVGLKFTEKMMLPEEFLNSLTDEEEALLNERIFSNNLLISTSSFYANKVSAPAYNTPLDNIICSGYPKNDLFYEHIAGEYIFTDIGLLEWLEKKKKKQKSQIIVYAPTFRDMNADYNYLSIINYTELDKFLTDNNLLFVIKGHTSIHLQSQQEQYKNIKIYANDRDGYPLLRMADLLITDYSSIYMDFLHKNNPIIYFPYDIKEYLEDHRKLQFDYFDMTPGPKAYTQAELIMLIEKIIIKKEDQYQVKRQEIFDIAFKHQDGLSYKRIEQAIEKLK